MYSSTLPQATPFTQSFFIGRAQTFANDPGPGQRPVSLITQRQVKPDRQTRFNRALREFLAFAQSFPGHWGVRVLSRSKDGQEFFAVVNHFANSAARCAFTSSPDFRVWLDILRETTSAIPDLGEPEAGRNAYPVAKTEVGPPNVSTWFSGIGNALRKQTARLSSLCARVWRARHRLSFLAIGMLRLGGWLQ